MKQKLIKKRVVATNQIKKDKIVWIQAKIIIFKN